MTELSILLGVAALVMTALYLRERSLHQATAQERATLQRELDETARQHKEASASAQRLRRDAPRLEAASRRDTIAKVITLDDHVQSALEHKTNATAEDLQAGLELLAKDLDQTWERLGLTRIHPATDELFDPEKHEAISSRPDPEVTETTIDAVLRDGFEDEVHLLRPALVTVRVSGEVEAEVAEEDEEEVAEVS